MTIHGRFFVYASFLLLIVVCGLWSETTLSHAAVTTDDKTATVPVEPDMHEFMEYVFQPTFRRLKPAMATAPTDNKIWKAIKADALILAEGGNLLLMREPQDDIADWMNHSVEVRDFGGEFYRAARAKDHTTARKHYEAMIESCNACHHQFANGEHILAP